MKQVVNRKGGYFVEAPGSGAAKIVAGFLLAVWLVLSMIAVFSGSWGEAFAYTLFVGGPAFAISHLWGSPKRHKIAAVIHANQVAGGVLLRVMDERQVQHELVVDEATAQGIAHILTGRTGIDA